MRTHLGDGALLPAVRALVAVVRELGRAGGRPPRHLGNLVGEVDELSLQLRHEPAESYSVHCGVRDKGNCLSELGSGVTCTVPGSLALFTRTLHVTLCGPARGRPEGAPRTQGTADPPRVTLPKHAPHAGATQQNVSLTTNHFRSVGPLARILELTLNIQEQGFATGMNQKHNNVDRNAGESVMVGSGSWGPNDGSCAGVRPAVPTPRVPARCACLQQNQNFRTEMESQQIMCD